MKKLAIVLLLLLGGSSILCGCGIRGGTDTPVPRWLEVDPRTGRGFYLYVPSGYRDDRPCPVIVTCHGTPPFDVSDLNVDEWKRLGEGNGCIIVAPSLVGTDGIWGDGPVWGMMQDERYIVSILSLLGYRYNIDMANIMITGFSGGGFPAYWIGLRHPELFSCLAARNCNFNEFSINGWFPVEDARAAKILVYYGENDLGPIKAQSDQAVRYLRERGFHVETTVIPGAGHERYPELAMDFFRRNWQPPRPSLPVQREAKSASR